MRPARRLFLALLLGALAPVSAQAERLIRAPADFVAAQFGDEVPAASLLWVTGSLREQVTAILGHPPRRLRERYWRQGRRSVWILEEIGKELPITAGFVVDDGRLRSAEVLVYRETRGGEIRLPAFLRQFAGRRLDAGGRLEGHIDNLTGATLSVRAMQRMAAVALTLDQALPAP